jgi:hypothetical protein
MTKSSTNDHKHPYLKVRFWQQPQNHFWENDIHSEKAKEYFRSSVERMVKEERRDYLIEKV